MCVCDGMRVWCKCVYWNEGVVWCVVFVCESKMYVVVRYGVVSVVCICVCCVCGVWCVWRRQGDPTNSITAKYTCDGPKIEMTELLNFYFLGGRGASVRCGPIIGCLCSAYVSSRSYLSFLFRRILPSFRQLLINFFKERALFEWSIEI